ncbi:deoxyribodipyrimidine photolyase [Betaproteobacteria bacterium GR16-43]|nr:deoxyribodipyrimidine photolyase [Betaproteobacteria bacterium GR16-43]
MKPYEAALFWFRRDLRVEDNAGLYYALTSARRVHCAFVFDRAILDALPSRSDRRVAFIHASLLELRESLARLGGELLVLHDHAEAAIPRLAASLRVDAVFANDDYEPAARARDAAVDRALSAAGQRMHLAKDQAIFDKDEVLTKAGGPFGVYTPYKNAWMAKVDDFFLQSYPVERHAAALAKPDAPAPVPALASLGFEKMDVAALKPGASGARDLFADFAKRIDRYRDARDFPGVKGVSYLSVHNRFGTISIRELARAARAKAGEGAATWLSELVWREFYFQVLWHHPHAATGAFRREYDAIRWPDDEGLFRAWCEARTGYPIVDAAMRQLNTTGYMHNRLRMIVASFLAKDLLVDWRRGERYFAEQLNDFDLAQNNGGWQWAASTGCDAQPYFRIFNPVTQSERFDAEGRFIRRYLPELAKVPDASIHAPWTMSGAEQAACGCVIGRDYPAPVVDHAAQREKALALYGKVKR